MNEADRKREATVKAIRAIGGHARQDRGQDSWAVSVTGPDHQAARSPLWSSLKARSSRGTCSKPTPAQLAEGEKWIKARRVDAVLIRVAVDPDDVYFALDQTGRQTRMLVGQLR